MNLQRQQCILHPERGAVACCPLCRRFYCHECITEHAGRMLCRHCLTVQLEQTQERPGFLQRHAVLIRGCLKPVLMLAGYILLWLVFTAVGAMLIRFPDDFHYVAPSDGEGG